MALVALSLGVPDVITCSATPSAAQEVTYPLNARRVFVRFRAADGQYFPTGTDAAAINADAVTVPVGQWFEIGVPGCTPTGRQRNLEAATRKGYFASATASAVFEIRAET